MGQRCLLNLPHQTRPNPSTIHASPAPTPRRIHSPNNASCSTELTGELNLCIHSPPTIPGIRDSLDASWNSYPLGIAAHLRPFRIGTSGGQESPHRLSPTSRTPHQHQNLSIRLPYLVIKLRLQ